MIIIRYLVVLFLSSLSLAADLYKVLDVDKSASYRDIKAAYKRMSKRYHPDKNNSPDAEAKFIEVAHAYEVLSDEETRRIYDQYGEEGLKAREGGGQRHTNPFDMFSSFFGRGHPGNQQARRGPSSLVQMEVTLADIYTGASLEFDLKKKILCDHCRGTGAASDSDIHTCSGCGGSGVKIVKQQIFPGMFAQSQMTCDECGGRGKKVVKQCPHCHGEKLIDHVSHYTLDLDPGVPEGHDYIYEGEADESPDWEAGDVIIRVQSRVESGGFRRKESSLYWKETIGVDEALLGFERNLTHLDGHIVRLIREGVTQPGFVQVVHGEGMPVFEQSTYGDLYVEYNVVLPLELSPDTRRELQQVFGAKRKLRDEL
ncbi:DnaJ-domain-containing protein [Fistulina hepatica ATCC 64428]|nr:DnaJ-domain-containing protein [Fistulina hepatica ATCC 64428]